eukprot:8788485-Heterocapsa_arctica.AAC.1
MQDQQAETEQEEKEAINTIRMHKTSERTAPWCTDMSDDQTRNIIRWVNKLDDTDPILQGVIEDEEVLFKEHKNSMLATNGHKQLQEALLGMRLPET